MNRIDFIDKASYLGKIILEDFDIGTYWIEDLGKVTMNIDVDGAGFTEKYLNTAIKGMLLK
jgi:hypothetical protein